MPTRQPFTQLCLALARFRHSARVDLHIHTTASDGRFSPEQVVDLARRAGMPAIAITDHDTAAGLIPARAHAHSSGDRVEVLSGVEISTEFRGKELHLLGYFFDAEDAGLNQAFDFLCQGRRERFFAIADRLRSLGHALDDERLRAAAATNAVGRRHLAQMLVDAHCVSSLREAFVRFLGETGSAFVVKKRIDVGEAISLLRKAGGVAAWAHPDDTADSESLRALYNLGMRAVEVDWPTAKPSRTRKLRDMARSLGLACTAGSDSHGPGRDLGACSIDLDDLERLERLAAPRAPVEAR